MFKRHGWKWALAVLIPVLALTALAPMHALHAATVGSHLIAMHPTALFSFAVLATDPNVLVSKSRKAQEFLGKAKEIRAEIEDPTKNFTKEELDKRATEINALIARANIVAGFTGDDEVERQGGTGDLERVDSPEARNQTQITHKRGTMQAKIEALAVDVIQEFGDIRSFMKISSSAGRMPMTPTQRKLCDRTQELTRAIVGTAGDASGGEFVLPLTQVQSIFSLANIQQGVLQRARAYNVPGRTLRIPMLYQSGENATTALNRPMAGQIANVSIVGEGSTGPKATPEFIQRLLTVYKYMAITQASDEILGDDFTGELPTEFINAVGQQALNKINEDVTYTGTNTAQPYAAVYPGGPHTLAVTRSGGANTLTISTTDVFKMYDRHTHGPKSFWLASRRCLEQLYAMSLTASSLVTFLKDLEGMPNGRLLGYPIVLTDILPTLGQDADFTLINPDFYAMAIRQALTVESSRDFAFDSDLTTYRFIVRAGGIPLNTGTYGYNYNASGLVDSHSPFVYLH